MSIVLVVGLGNPGTSYSYNRHNVGFLFADWLIDTYSFSPFKKHGNGLVSKHSIKNNDVVICKPHTFMNRSGQNVIEVANFFKIPSSNWIVVHDDLDMVFGKTKIKLKGGAGGHNGIRSISSLCGSDEYARLKIGIDRPPGHQDPADYVLENFSKLQLQQLYETTFDEVCDKLEVLIESISKGNAKQLATLDEK